PVKSSADIGGVCTAAFGSDRSPAAWAVEMRCATARSTCSSEALLLFMTFADLVVGTTAGSGLTSMESPDSSSAAGLKPAALKSSKMVDSGSADTATVGAIARRLATADTAWDNSAESSLRT